jgi:hypothetical protein
MVVEKTQDMCFNEWKIVTESTLTIWYRDKMESWSPVTFSATLENLGGDDRSGLGHAELQQGVHSK